MVSPCSQEEGKQLFCLTLLHSGPSKLCYSDRNSDSALAQHPRGSPLSVKKTHIDDQTPQNLSASLQGFGSGTMCGALSATDFISPLPDRWGGTAPLFAGRPSGKETLHHSVDVKSVILGDWSIALYAILIRQAARRHTKMYKTPRRHK